MGENRIDPKHAENNGTDHGKQGGKGRPSHSPEGGTCNLIRTLQKQERHCQGHSIHGKFNFLGIYSIDLYQGIPSEQDDCGQRRGANDPLQHAQPKDLSAPGVLSRSIVLAINVMAVCAKALMIKYPKYSKFNAAAIPATALEPKLFTAVWRQIFEMENTADCTAAGTPIQTTLFSWRVLILNLRNSSRMLSRS